VDKATRQALRLALESERAFGVDALPLFRGPADATTRSEEGTEAAEPLAAASPPAPASSSTAAPPANSPPPPGPLDLETLAQRIESCRACSLGESRRHAVPGEGPRGARLMFIGEAPGEQEDATGRPFVGRAGELLTKMIGAMGLSREEVFIGNLLKCRPPQNRDPAPEEAHACFHFLEDQIDLVRPEVICTLGGHAAQNLLQRDEPMYKMRGRVFSYRGLDLVPTYHPSFLLRKPEMKRKAWEDLQVVMQLLAKKA
jgi:uracil-DNA glycosylase